MSNVKATAPLDRDPWRTTTLAAGGGVGPGVGRKVAVGRGVGFGVGLGVGLAVGLGVGSGVGFGPAVGGAVGALVGPVIDVPLGQVVGAADAYPGIEGPVGPEGGHDPDDIATDGVGPGPAEVDAEGPNEHPPTATTRTRLRHARRQCIGTTGVHGTSPRDRNQRPSATKAVAERPDRPVRDLRLPGASRMAVGAGDAPAVPCCHEVIQMPTAEAATATIATRPSAVAWIDDRHAYVATNAASGDLLFTEIVPRPGVAGHDQTYLARVVDAIGDRERIAILGPDTQRLALEREYVMIFHRPERLIDVEPSSLADRIEIAERLRSLSAA
jgi:hypothetical protein